MRCISLTTLLAAASVTSSALASSTTELDLPSSTIVKADGTTKIEEPSQTIIKAKGTTEVELPSTTIFKSSQTTEVEDSNVDKGQANNADSGAMMMGVPMLGGLVGVGILVAGLL